MPERHHEQVPPADREAVPAGIAQLIPGDDVLSEGTRRTGISPAPCIEPPDLDEIFAFLPEPFQCRCLPESNSRWMVRAAGCCTKTVIPNFS